MNKTSSRPAGILRAILLPTLVAGALAAGLATTAAPSLAASWSFGGERVEGNGSIKRQARQVSHFTGLALEVPGKLELRLPLSDMRGLREVRAISINGQPAHLQPGVPTLGYSTAALSLDAAQLGAPLSVQVDMVVAGTDGFVLSRSQRKYVARGENVAKVVGTTPLPQRRGYLLED